MADLGVQAREAAVRQIVELNESRQASVPEWARHRTSWPEDLQPETDVARLANPLRPPGEVAEAAQRLARGSFRRPINPGRWPFVRTALRDAAELHGVDEGTELEHLTMSALFEAINCIDTAQDLDENWSRTTRERIAANLNRMLCEDLLGPGWRQGDLGPGAENTAPEEATDRALRVEEAAAAILTAVSRFGLTPRERDVILTIVIQGAETPSEVARLLGIAPATARVLTGRIRGKLPQDFSVRLRTA